MKVEIKMFLSILKLSLDRSPDNNFSYFRWITSCRLSFSGGAIKRK